MANFSWPRTASCEDGRQALGDLWCPRGYLEVRQQVGGGSQSHPAGVSLTPPGSPGGATHLGRRREGRDTRRPGRGPLFSRHRAIGCEDVLRAIDGVVVCTLPGSLRAKTGLGEPRVGRNFPSELEDAGCPLEFAEEPSAGVTSVEVFGAQLGTTSCRASATRASSRRDFTPSFLKIDRR
jgi:hypothetical protein